MRTRALLKPASQSLPKVGTRIGIVKDIARAQDRMHGVATGDLKDTGHHVHACSREFFLRILGERFEASSEVPVGSVEKLQHHFTRNFGVGCDVALVSVVIGASAIGPATIRKVAWNRRVTDGTRYRSWWYSFRHFL